MILLSIIPLVLFTVLLLQGSDSFWENLPQTITAIGVLIGIVLTAIATIKANKAAKLGIANKAAIEEVHKTTNSKMDLLLAAKDDVAKANEEVAFQKGQDEQRILSDKEKAAENVGKLSVLENQKKEIPSTDIHAENIANKVVDKVVKDVVTEKDDDLKHKT